jgi:cytochrome oxidase Cu insertion factor (SCO1/SenC/PrrC family)
MTLLFLRYLIHFPGLMKFLFVKSDSADQNPRVLERVTPISAEVGPKWISKAPSQAEGSRIWKAPEPAADAGASDAPPDKRVKKSALGTLGWKPKNRIPTSSG